MKQIFLFLFLACITIGAKAQTVNISGVVRSEDSNSALPGASVRLLSTDGLKLVTGDVSEDSGVFNISVKRGNYIAVISFVGYAEARRNVSATKGDISLGIIKLKPSDEVLQAAEIVATVAPVTVQSDTIVLNADAFTTSNEATMGTLLEKMPGVTISSGKITAQGEDVKKVLVDGKPFFGEDPNSALENIPAGMVKKIEIYDQMSEQAQLTGFDDGESSKTVNVVTREEYRTGVFGTFYGAYGNDGKYNAGGNINLFKEDKRISVVAISNNVNEQNFSSQDLMGAMQGGSGKRSMGRPGETGDLLGNSPSGVTSTNAVGVNYSDQLGEKLELSASYFYNQTQTISTNDISRQYVNSGFENQTYSESEYSESTNENHRFNLRLDYKINDKTSLLYIPSFVAQTNTQSQSLFANTMNAGEALNQTSDDSEDDYTAMKIYNELLFRHKFDKPGRTFSIWLRQQYNTTDGESNLQSATWYDFGAMADSVDQNTVNDQLGESYTGKIIYTEPIGDNSLVQLNYRVSYNYSDSDKEVFSFNSINNTYDLLSTDLSNTLESRYVTQSAGMGYQYNKSGLYLTAQTDVQYAHLFGDIYYPESASVNRYYLNVLPSFRMKYKIAKGTNLMINLRSSTQQPSIDELQSVVDVSNPLLLTAGNPELGQQVNYSLRSMYNHFNSSSFSSFFSMISLQYSNSYIANSTTYANTDTLINGIAMAKGTQLVMPINLDGYAKLRGMMSYGIPVKAIHSNVNLNLSAAYSRTPGLINNELNYSNSPDISLGVVVASNINEKIDFTISTDNSISFVQNTLDESLNSNYYINSSKLRFYYNFWRELIYRSDITYTSYTGLSDSYNEDFFLWNMSLATRFLKNKKGELMISAHDILNQNQSISRTITDNYIQDSRSNVLEQYALLTFTYRINENASNSEQKSRDGRNGHQGPPPGEGGRF